MGAILIQSIDNHDVPVVEGIVVVFAVVVVLANLLADLLYARPTSGEVIFRGTDLVTLRGAWLLQARRHLQMVFQAPFGSLDPKWRVRDLVEEPLIAYKTGDRAARRRRVDEVLELVGLAPRRGPAPPGSCPAARPSGWPSRVPSPSTRR